MAKLVYRPLSMLISIAGGILAGAIFKRIWKLAPGQDEVPKATDAALQGAIFAVVTASVERLAAAGTRSLTGTWPGEDSDVEKEQKA
jgi:hypothetical protein